MLADRAPDLAARLPDPQEALSACHLCELLMAGPDARRIRQVCDAYVTDQLTDAILSNAEQLAAILPAGTTDVEVVDHDQPVLADATHQS
ncbi:MAG: hypothetical protein L0Y54_16175 [Sporichthyaceae bacterium]|nr:hypothetical protein [Sporichthyaceae bacterium]